MELNWSTFVLEIINFMVLIWILKHFLYKPVQDVIARRRAGIEKDLADAKELHANAEKLKEKFEGRLTEWERERQQAHEDMLREFDDERICKTAELQTALEQQREKSRVAEARRQDDVRRKVEETALDQAARFATRLLEQASGPDTQTRLVELVINELKGLPDKGIEKLRDNVRKTPGEIVVTSAFPLVDDQRQRLEQVLTGVIDADLSMRYEQKAELLAGLRITIGAWALGANIMDELKGFVELARNG